MRFENARLAVERAGVKKRKNVRAELRKTAPIVGKVCALGVRESAFLVNEISNACNMRRLERNIDESIAYQARRSQRPRRSLLLRAPRCRARSC